MVRPARNKADAFQHAVVGEIGRGHRREALAHEDVDGVLLQSQFQEHGFVFEEIKSVAGNVGAAFKIDQIEFFGQFHVIQRFKVEFRQRGFAAEEFQIGIVVHAHGRLGMGKIRNRAVDLIELDRDGINFCLDVLIFFPQPAPFLLAGVALGGIFCLTDGLRDLIRPAVEIFHFGLQLFPLFFERNKVVHIDLHAAVDAVLFD
jgi:hypothetical protein